MTEEKPNPVGRPATSIDAVHDEVVATAVTLRVALPIAEIARRLDKDPGYVSRAFKRLVAEGKLVKSEHRGVYYLPDEG